jgi:hypothetical protein
MKDNPMTSRSFTLILSAMVLCTGAVLICPRVAYPQLSPERRIMPPRPPLADETQIDAEMARNMYGVSNIATVPARADPGRPSTHTIALMPGHWAIAVFPVVAYCRVSVSFTTKRGEPPIPADSRPGFAVITVDTTGGTSFSDIMMVVTTETPGIGCPYRIKSYRK